MYVRTASYRMTFPPYRRSNIHPARGRSAADDISSSIEKESATASGARIRRVNVGRFYRLQSHITILALVQHPSGIWSMCV